MKLSENAQMAVQTLFDEKGRMDDAFVINGWPYCAMAQPDLDRLKSGLMELDALGLLAVEQSVANGVYRERRVLKRIPDLEPAWTDGIDANLPVQ